MIFSETPLVGAYLIDIEPIEDVRGFFARSFCKNEFTVHGLQSEFVQCNIASNYKKGTLRGMHYQLEPYAEVKLVRCIRGSIYDVVIDLREKSSTFKKWFSVELSAGNCKMLYVPEGFAHGYQTLTDDTEVFYQVSEFYQPNYERGIRWDDGNFDIQWPLQEKIISSKDRNWDIFNGKHSEPCARG
ncbi:dTDP-4-dehydrorhamnose 3,5-epimerase [Desulfosporosinus sp. PR]|uniref:dTDP-4-dehydrorhamnose 3,5-epimerase n=1 Tax=Candidatus Desulfosporosinus nitrosoreducens TaxID=3401928 RepID=UPI0027FF784A|nr:dTDP-4-dehydrorhamnose 3,5-epimerase [Desulfosporosinus sp. PR]MDQ7096254.1 dTDP-4-dehydrorhamnose 3,5-epimerase [Desulfosporosinus sp. PR]